MAFARRLARVARALQDARGWCRPSAGKQAPSWTAQAQSGRMLVTVATPRSALPGMIAVSAGLAAALVCIPFPALPCPALPCIDCLAFHLPHFYS